MKVQTNLFQEKLKEIIKQHYENEEEEQRDEGQGGTLTL